MNDCAHIALYRQLISCYPRTFRDEYQDDLTTTFALQLAEHGTTRCWLRTARDLMITIPTQHLEPRMKHPPASAVIATCLALAVGAALTALAIGTSFYGLLLILLAVLAVAFAVIARRAGKPALALEHSASWKKYLATGSTLLLILIVLLNLPDTKDQELSEIAWATMMATMLFSFTLIGAGIVLGAGQLANNRHR